MKVLKVLKVLNVAPQGKGVMCRLFSMIGWTFSVASLSISLPFASAVVVAILGMRVLGWYWSGGLHDHPRAEKA